MSKACYRHIDKMHGLNTYDYGARQYNPVTARWDRIDPLCEKYYSTSPYVYCVNNPVNAIDPDGRYVWLLYNVTVNGKTTQKRYYFDGTQSKCPNDPFIKAFIKVYNTLKAMGTGEPLIEGVTSKKIGLYVGEGTRNSYDPENNTVWWDYKYTTYTTDGGKRSAAVSLVHEFDHGVDYNKNPQEHIKRQSAQPSNSQYDNAEEERVITGSEKETATKLGQASLTNHQLGYKGIEGYISAGPLSVKPLEQQKPKQINKRPITSFIVRFFN